MALYMIGIGLCDEKDISVKGLEAVRAADEVYLERYTNILQVPMGALESFYQKKLIQAARGDVEQGGDGIIESAKSKDVAFLVVGDVFSATTHSDLYLRAKKAGVRIHVIHNASVLTAVGVTGLSIYKFGKTASIPFAQGDCVINTPFEVLVQNLEHGLHTLMLLDLDPVGDRFLSVSEAIGRLLEMERRKHDIHLLPNSKIVVCARLGCPDQMIRYGRLADLLDLDFGKPPYCIIFPAKMHFMEEEVLSSFI